VHSNFKYIFILCIILFIYCPDYIFSSDTIFENNQAETTEAKVIVVSDTQDPLWIEELFLASNNNKQARGQLFQYILDEQPDAVFHLGDLVSLGFSDESWMPIDIWLNQLQAKGIPLYPTLGNHELLLFSEAGEENFNVRFPFYSKTGYTKQIGPVSFILLNSNMSDLTDEEITYQQFWFKKELARSDADSTVKAIIVGCHHPPFTNSKIVNPDEDVREYFLSGFVNSKKSVIFLSGHSHSFEHFNVSGKDFLTIGGGGGLHHPLYQEEESLFMDLYQGNSNRRIFHYLDLSISNTELNLKVQMLSPDFSKIETVYELDFRFFNQYIVESK
jgi:3',5'-cyclic AMP phosphodiesterase CpdA